MRTAQHEFMIKLFCRPNCGHNFLFLVFFVHLEYRTLTSFSLKELQNIANEEENHRIHGINERIMWIEAKWRSQTKWCWNVMVSGNHQTSNNCRYKYPNSRKHSVCRKWNFQEYYTTRAMINGFEVLLCDLSRRISSTEIHFSCSHFCQKMSILPIDK